MATNKSCDNCGSTVEAEHIIHHDNGDGTEIYCTICWITNGYSTKRVDCPNIEEGQTKENHSCPLCDNEGVGEISVSTCCNAPEEWQDCELPEEDGTSHEECFKTVCSSCGYTLYRDCFPDKTS